MTMAKRGKKCWSYNAGERGRNWVRAYEDGSGGKLYLEWRDQGRRSRALLRDVHDTDTAKQRADDLVAALGKMEPKVTKAPMTLAQLLRLYGKEATPFKGESKQAHDRRATMLWLAFFDGHEEASRRSIRHPSTLDRTDWDRFIQARRRGSVPDHPREVGDRQVQYDLKFMIAVLNWAAGHKVEGRTVLEGNPWQGALRRMQKWGMPREKSPARPGMAEDLRQGLIAHSPNWQFELALVLGRETLRRNHSIRNLRWSDINLEDEAVRWRDEFDKSGNERVTPLFEESIRALKNAPSRGIGEAPVFPSATRPDKATSRHTFQTWLRRAKKRFLESMPEPERGKVRERLKHVGFHSEKREGVRDQAFRMMSPKIQEELAGTTFETLSQVYDYVGVEDMREERNRAKQAVSVGN
jgi:integrase